MVEKVRLSCLNGAAVDLSDTFLTVSNNIISRSTLGRVYVNEGSDENFGGLSRKVIDLLASFCFKDTFHFLGWMDTLTGLVAGLKNTSRALHDFLDKVIEEHESLMNNDESHMKDMVDILLDLQKNGALGIDLTGENIKAILMSSVPAADTSADVLWHGSFPSMNSETFSSSPVLNSNLIVVKRWEISY
ncbi:CYTOCHROME P450 FAMILY 71 PROTEIN [Salix purpurea]|uniref:CYTOCHROME P450 FAMILY 71 PROTEIN n=1 Tax=Salix purpurea TaxID=77065 RepID=A0A9Q0ZR55_SALPP|nr:CYTOCHROME P450 FAMILY 71 PROTEIN [Salix purpurea]